MSVMLSLAFIPGVPRHLPLFHSDVRQAALRAIEQLRGRGYWVTLMRLDRIVREEGRTCFILQYTYRTRTRDLPTTSVHTCADA